MTINQTKEEDMKTQVLWKCMMMGIVAGVALTATSVPAQSADMSEEMMVRTDNRGPGSLNSGPGSLHSGRDQQGERGRRGGDDLVVAHVGLRQDGGGDNGRKGHQDGEAGHDAGSHDGLFHGHTPG
jgi:hypothetical protein